MKKWFKITLNIIVICICLSSVFAAQVTIPSGGNVAEDVEPLMNNIWATVSIVFNVLAFAAILFAGIRYMFSAADARADIKRQTVVLIIGGMLVFLVQPVVQFIVEAAKSIM
ncbi:MAG: hypothetical protein RSB51_03075 [Clostridia bacterium]